MKNHSVYQFIFERKRMSILILLLGIVSQVFTIIIPISVGKYYQLAFGFQSTRIQFLHFIPNYWWNSVPKFLLFFIALVALRYLFFFSYQFLLRKESEIFVRTIKDRLFLHQMQINYSIYQEKGIGKYLLRYSGDINSLKNLYLKGSISVCIDIFIIVVAMIWFAGLSKMGAFSMLTFSLTAYVFIYLLNEKIEDFSRQKRNKTSGQLAFVNRTLHSILTVITMNKQSVKHKKYKKKSARIQDVAIQFNFWRSLNRGFISFFQYLLLAMLLAVFYYSDTEKINEANLISFILLYITILPTIRRLFSLTTVYKMGNISLNKLNHILQLKKENITQGKTLHLSKAPTIAFSHFALKAEHKKLNVNIKAGEQKELNLTKATIHLSKAMLGLEKEYTGSIHINETNIDEFSAKSLRENISIASPQIPLVGRTVYEAITIFRAKRIEDKTEKLLQEIQAKFDVEPLQLREPIGENGSNLSILQYELLCFIRSINNEKKILLIDHFSLLNNTTIQGILKDYLPKRTMVWL